MRDEGEVDNGEIKEIKIKKIKQIKKMNEK